MLLLLFFFAACLFFLVFFMGREDSKFYECITEDLAENMNEANSRSMTWFKRKILFLLMQSIECKDSCTTNFESGEENLNELASYIESPTELKLIVNV